MNAHPNAGIFGEFSGVSLVAFTSISGKFGRRFHGDLGGQATIGYIFYKYEKNLTFGRVRPPTYA